MFRPPITAKIQHDDVVNDVINFKNRAVTQISFKNPQKWLFSYHNPALIYRHSPLATRHSPLATRHSLLNRQFPASLMPILLLGGEIGGKESIGG